MIGFLGTLGPIVFSTSSLRVLNFNNFNRTTKKRTVRHDVIDGKPRTEYLGADLSTLVFDIRMDITYGVQPSSMLALLRTMAESGTAYPLIVGGRPVGFNCWSVDSVSESWDTVYSGGELACASARLTLTEYVPMM